MNGGVRPEAGAWRDTCLNQASVQEVWLPGPQEAGAVARSGVVLTPGREGVCSAAAVHGLRRRGCSSGEDRQSCSAACGTVPDQTSCISFCTLC